MNRAGLEKIPLRANPFAGLGEQMHRVLFGLFLIAFALVWARVWLATSLLGAARWPEGLLVVLTVGTTLVSLTRQLPGQNVILAAGIIAVIGGGVESLDARTGIPFGPCEYTDNIGPELFRSVRWVVPMEWVAVVLTARGVRRLMLRPWRKTKTYGFWLIGVTAALIVLLDLGLQPFATRVKELWDWQPTKLPLDWYSAPWVNFVGRGVTAVLILAFATPCLINKKSSKRPPDYHPLVVWLLLNLLFATGAAAHQLWAAVAVIVAGSGVVAVFAVRGARW